MARLNISELPMPADKFRPDLATSAGSKPIESEEDARSEDVTRLNLLRKATSIAEDPQNVVAARGLARRLDYGDGQPPATMASSLHMRDQRIRVAGSLWQLLSENPDQHALPFTLIPKDGEYAGDRLADFDPVRSLSALRSALHRCGSRNAHGFFFAVTDGEYEVASDTWRAHFHGIASSGMVDVVERLRDTSTYRSTRTAEGEARKVQRVRIERSLTNLPEPLTYLVKSYWSARWEGTVEGRSVRQSRRSRIPEPRHSQWLLWMDRWAFQDLCVLVGTEVGRDGLRLTERTSIKGEEGL